MPKLSTWKYFANTYTHTHTYTHMQQHCFPLAAHAHTGDEAKDNLELIMQSFDVVCVGLMGQIWPVAILKI